VEYYQGILQDQQAHEQQFCLPAATSPNSTPEPCLSDVGRLIESSNSQKGSLHPPHQECISDAPTQQPLELVPSSPQGWSSNLPQSPAQFIPLQEFANEPPHCLTLCNTAAGLQQPTQLPSIENDRTLRCIENNLLQQSPRPPPFINYNSPPQLPLPPPFMGYDRIHRPPLRSPFTDCDRPNQPSLLPPFIDFNSPPQLPLPPPFMGYDRIHRPPLPDPCIENNLPHLLPSPPPFRESNLPHPPFTELHSAVAAYKTETKPIRPIIYEWSSFNPMDDGKAHRDRVSPEEHQGRKRPCIIDETNCSTFKKKIKQKTKPKYAGTDEVDDEIL
jgi:hypothetical protein